MDSIQITYPNYYLFFIAVIAVLYALSLYINDTKLKENKSWLPKVLGIFRFLSILSILFLLLAPLLKQIVTEEEKPIIVTLRDISSSVTASVDSALLNNIDDKLSEIESKTANKYNWKRYYFGQSVNTEKDDSLNRLSSNLSAPLEYISELYEDQNIGSVILVSDGIYNEGKNPLYANSDLTVPVHTIAVGDTSQRKDVLIKNVLHNRIVYLNDKFLIETDIQAYNAKSNRTQLNLYKNIDGKNKFVESRNINIDKDNFFETYTFEIEANTLGNVKYRVSIGNIGNELSVQNNSRNIYIEVLDARQKILLLSHSTHPDLKLLKNVVTSNKNYEIEVANASDFKNNLKKFDILILHNLPSLTNPISGILDQSKKDKMPTFFIAGNETDKQLFNNANNVLSITGESFNLNNVTPVLNRDFNVFTYSDELGQRIERFVPLKAPFGDYVSNPASKILLNQKIGSVETPYPLLAYIDLNGHKQAVLCGEGIWKWNLMEYFETEDIGITKELLFKTIQYISQKDDKRQFRAFANKKNYQENETVQFDAQLYNDNYELINDQEVSLAIMNDKNERFDYIFSKSNDYYAINAGRFPEGNYSFTARTNYNGKNLNASGSFTVQSIMKENYDLTARHDILASISNNTGGEMIYPENMPRLDSLLSKDKNIKTIMYQKASTHSIMDWPWLLLIIILLLSIEWFGRRYFGAY